MDAHPPSSPVNRRQFLAGSFGTAALVGVGSLSAGVVLSACSDGGSSSPPTAVTTPATSAPLDLASALAAPGAPGLVDEAVYQRRVGEFLEFATRELDVESPSGIAAQLVRAHREPGYSWDTSAATVASLQEVWTRFDEWQDVRDFRRSSLSLCRMIGPRGSLAYSKW